MLSFFSSSTSRYHYEQLPCCAKSHGPHLCKYIRLLKVLYVAEDHVECSLKLCRLPTGPKEDGCPHPIAKYHCLSYTWGEPFKSIEESKISASHHNIKRWNVDWIASLFYSLYRRLVGWYLKRPPEFKVICDGCFIPITRNLWEALVALTRQADYAEALDAIWIDQICINQDNEKIEEKSSQVRIMHDIYENAERVIMWLGPGDQQDNVYVIQHAREVAQELQSIEMENPQTRADLTNALRFNPFARHLTTKFGAEHWLSVRQLLRPSYFNRMWVFQEVVAAKSIIVTYGSHTIAWSDICSLSQAFMSFASGFLVEHHTTTPQFALQYYIPHTLELWRSRFRGNPIKGLRPWLYGLVAEKNRGMYACQLGHDMLYAHFGICRYTDIKPDYSKTVEEAYTEFWCQVMRDLGDVNLLTVVEDDNGNPKRRWKWPGLWDVLHGRIMPRRPMASWVPDFQKRKSPEGLTQHYSRASPIAGAGYGCAFYASGSPERPNLGDCTYAICSISIVLSINSYRIDVIAEMSETTNDFTQGHNKYSILQLLRLINSILAKPSAYSGNSATVAAICTTMAVLSKSTGELEEDLIKQPGRTQQLFSLWLLHMLCMSKAYNYHSRNITEQNKLLNQTFSQSGFIDILPSPTAVATEAEQHSTFVRTRTENLRKGIDAPLFTQHRVEGYVGLDAVMFGNMGLKEMRLFSTATGYVGKGPQSLRPGDEICIFPGGYVPFILRKGWNGKHTLVGHAYVHGIMHGELVERLSTQSAEIVEIQ